MLPTKKESLSDVLNNHLGKIALKQLEDTSGLSSHSLKITFNNVEKTLRMFTYPNVLWLQEQVTSLNPLHSTIVLDWFGAQEHQPLKPRLKK